LRLKKKEERELKEAGNKRAKEIAEQNYRVSYFVYFTTLFCAVMYCLLSHVNFVTKHCKHDN